jgi:hypothetical protein
MAKQICRGGLFCWIVVASHLNLANADIKNWQTGQTIPGTEGITPRQGINLGGWQTEMRNLRFADFSGLDLSGAYFADSWLDDALFTGANLTNAYLQDAWVLGSTIVDSETVYNQWTQFPSGFSPVAAGMMFKESPAGDFDGNDVLELSDVDLLMAWIRGTSPFWWLDGMFDLNRDGRVSGDDLHVWVKDLRQTWFGDANLDGEFNSSDLVTVFAAGEYEDAFAGNSTWEEGDWNADGDFTSGDLIVAFQDGGYELGPRQPIAAVPEPSGVLLAALAVIVVSFVSRNSGRTPVLLRKNSTPIRHTRFSAATSTTAIRHQAATEIAGYRSSRWKKISR